MSVRLLSPTTRLARHLSRYALAATLIGSAGALYAAQPASAPSAGHAHHAAMMQHRLDALHAQLKLTPAQEPLWQSALATMRADHEQARTLHQQARQRMDALMQAPVLDPRALQSEHQQTEQQMQQLRAHTEAAWFTLYDALDATQKVTASDALKARWKHMAHHHGHMRHDGAAHGSQAGNGVPPAPQDGTAQPAAAK